MKILHVITSLRTGGAEKLMVDLLPLLRNKGNEVDLCVFDGVETPFKRELESQGINIISLGTTANVYHLKYLCKLVRLIKTGGYDVVHTHNTAPQLFAAISSIICSQVMCTTEHTTSNRRSDWKWYVAIDRWMYSRYKFVICISEKTEYYLRSHIGKCHTRILTIPNGINVAKYRDAEPVNIKQIFPGCRKAIVQVAGFRYQKDQDTVIRALSELPDEFHLFLVGDGERRQELELLVKSLNLNERVHFMGIRSDVAKILRGADIAVMSSHFEGFGLAAVEAMATGMPLLASDVDGLREVTLGAGILFPHQDATSLANKIIEIDSNPDLYASIADKCSKRAVEYDISTMATAYYQCYKDTLTNSCK